VRTAVFIQVRLGSTRLPSKALLPFAGSTVISHVMKALHTVPAEIYALVTDAASAEALRGEASAESFEVFVGPGEDVLARYCGAARLYGADRVIRATGDNPLTSPALVAGIRALHDAHGADLSHYLGNPWGTGVEVIESGVLFAAEREAVLQDEREHITTWHYRHRERFVILEPWAPRECLLPEAKVSIDTSEDYARISELYESLYHGRPIETDALVTFLTRTVHA
jgi:spore coat polysaccharide biosynthesis protein SpsF